MSVVETERDDETMMSTDNPLVRPTSVATTDEQSAAIVTSESGTPTLGEAPTVASNVHATDEESAVVSNAAADATPPEVEAPSFASDNAVGEDDEENRDYHDIDDDAPTEVTSTDDHGQEEERVRDGNVEVALQATTDLPVAVRVPPPQPPPPELLERLRQLESREPQVIAEATPRDIEEEERAARRKLWRKFWLVFAWFVSIAVVGVVIAVAMGPSSQQVDTGIEPAAGPPTPSPTSQGFADLKGLIASVSFDQGAALDDEFSPQYEALTWLDGNTNLEAYPDWKRIQRYVLAVLYYGTSGDDWLASDGWLSDEDECTWLTFSETHPTCNGNGTYNQITLIENDLEGTVPLELALLSDSLNRLYLWGHTNLTGPIPSEMGLLTNIGFFNLAWNALTGTVPTELSLLRGISEFGLYETNRRFRGQYIDVGHNQLSGIIPSVIFELPELRNLRLSGNSLTGSIPSEIGLATELVILRLNINGLTGSLPTELGKLSLLELFWSNLNNHTGSIPTELGLCTSFFELALPGNVLSGPLPSEIGLLTDLEQLWIDDNKMTGPLPSEIGVLSLLDFVVLRDNLLTGPLPTEFGNIEGLLMLDVVDNMISGSIPSELGRLTDLQYLWLYTNGLTGVIPSELGLCESLDFLALDGNRALNGTFPVELTSISNLEYLAISATDLTGTLPSEIGLWRSMFWALWDADGLSGTLPTEFGLMSSLQRLQLSGKSMAGTVASEFGQLSLLEWFQVTNATVQGSLPSELANLSSLVQINITNTSIIGPMPVDLTRFPRLKSLALENSQFVGQIPPSVGDLASSLETLALANNAFTGVVPSEILILTNLDTLRLYGNNLTGPFTCPDFIEDCLVSCDIDGEPSCRMLE